MTWYISAELVSAWTRAGTLGLRQRGPSPRKWQPPRSYGPGGGTRLEIIRFCAHFPVCHHHLVITTLLSPTSFPVCYLGNHSDNSSALRKAALPLWVGTIPGNRCPDYGSWRALGPAKCTAACSHLGLNKRVPSQRQKGRGQLVQAT